MNINPMNLVHLKPKMTAFGNRHSRFVQFFSTVRDSGLKEGTVIEISVTDPEGKQLCANMRACAEDIELINELTDMMKSV